MSETPYYFNNGNYRLFGILYKPDDTDVKEGFIFCHPFAEEKLWTQRVMVNFARELMQKGYAVLRFDFMGHGDSEGDFEDSTIESRLSDIEAAYETFIKNIPTLSSVNLLGLRFGATLAALAAERLRKINKLILWDPVTDGNKYMQEMLRINLTTQTAVYKEIRYTRNDLIKEMENGETVNIDGYEISNDFFQQALEIDLLKKKSVFSGKTFLVQINKTMSKIRKDLEQLIKNYQNVDFEIAEEYPFWKEIKIYYSRAEYLYKITLDWLALNER